ncbi:MAG: Rossmann-like and DUF2520 domain-containing protein [Acidimicrobiales bacterium]
MKVHVIGAGRAGRSFERALSGAGIEVDLLPARSLAGPSGLFGAAHGTDVVLLAVADRYVAEVASLIEPDPDAVLLHCSGSLGLNVLAEGAGGPHQRRGSIHPLATLPDPVVGSLRLRGGTFFAVSGDQVATDLVLVLGGQPIVVAPEQRARYHAAACVASNHLVALLGQVQRIASQAGLPLAAFVPLAKGALDDVTMLGPAGALTGPAARGDLPTLEAHRAVLDQSELDGYDAGVRLAERLATGDGRTKEPERTEAAGRPASAVGSRPWS